MLLELADSQALDDFKFTIMGSGWEPVIEALRTRKIEVQYYDQFDYETYCQLIPSLDYFLYLGSDEGSMGFVDALAAGVQTIVTPQGFHLDAEEGITFAISDVNELAKVFSDIAQRRQRLIQSVSSWTWPEYARKHLQIWETLLTNSGDYRKGEQANRYVCEAASTNTRDRSSAELMRSFKRRVFG
jgi:glycosyltransferase involved in cell wall biosynthesis